MHRIAALWGIPLAIITLVFGLYPSLTLADRLQANGYYLLSIVSLLLVPSGWLVAKAIPGLRKNAWMCLALTPVFGMILSIAASLVIPELIDLSGITMRTWAEIDPNIDEKLNAPLPNRFAKQ